MRMHEAASNTSGKAAYHRVFLADPDAIHRLIRTVIIRAVRFKSFPWSRLVSPVYLSPITLLPDRRERASSEQPLSLPPPGRGRAPLFARTHARRPRAA